MVFQPCWQADSRRVFTTSESWQRGANLAVVSDRFFLARDTRASHLKSHRHYNQRNQDFWAYLRFPRITTISASNINTVAV